MTSETTESVMTAARIAVEDALDRAAWLLDAAREEHDRASSDYEETARAYDRGEVAWDRVAGYHAVLDRAALREERATNAHSALTKAVQLVQDAELLLRENARESAL